MKKAKRSFFEKLTGSIKVDDYDMEYEDEERSPEVPSEQKSHGWIEEQDEGQLTIDMHQTPSEIVIKTMIAGVRPDDIDISITRDMVTIKGKRENERDIREEDYFHRELYWGSFSRTILLPAEVDADAAEAAERHGLLIIRMPKMDKGRQTKLKVKSN